MATSEFQEWLNNTDNLYMLSNKSTLNYMEMVFTDRQTKIWRLEKEIKRLKAELKEKNDLLWDIKYYMPKVGKKAKTTGDQLRIAVKALEEIAEKPNITYSNIAKEALKEIQNEFKSTI